MWHRKLRKSLNNENKYWNSNVVLKTETPHTNETGASYKYTNW